MEKDFTTEEIINLESLSKKYNLSFKDLLLKFIKNVLELSKKTKVVANYDPKLISFLKQKEISFELWDIE